MTGRGGATKQAFMTQLVEDDANYPKSSTALMLTKKINRMKYNMNYYSSHRQSQVPISNQWKGSGTLSNYGG